MMSTYEETRHPYYRSRIPGPVISLICLIAMAIALPQQADASKQVLTMNDYGLWRTVTSTQLSPDGHWMTYDYRKPEADNDAPDERNLQIKHLLSEKVYQVPFAVSPAFSEDAKWIAYQIDLDRKEATKLRDQKKPIPRKVQLLNLETGDKLTWENASSFRFSKSSNVLAIQKPRAKGVEHAGSDLIIHALNTKLDHHFGSVSQYRFNKPGTLVAYTRDAADKTANGLYIMDFNSGLRIPLDQEAATYRRMTWNENGAALAVLKGDTKKGFLYEHNSLLAFTDLPSVSPVRHELNPAESLDFPKHMVMTEKADLSWNTEATMVFFGIKAQVPEPNKVDAQKDKKDTPLSDLDVWHWKDLRIQSVQRARAQREKNAAFRSVYHLETKQFVQLTDNTMKRITLTRDGKWGVGRDDRAYVHDWKALKGDYYRVNTQTGERHPMLTGLRRSLGVSPDSKHFAYWKDAHVWVCHLDSGNTTNLTQNAPVSFVNQEYDYPDERPSYGLSGWTKDGSGVILNHRYDLWYLSLSGTQATNLTSGLGDEGDIRFRFMQLDKDEKFINLSEPIMLSAYGQWTKKSGFYRLTVGDIMSGSINRPEPLIYKERSLSRLRKAIHSDQYMFSSESFTDCPDYYVADAPFKNLRRITDANPQQVEYQWGHRILFEYANKDGVRLQGALAIPDTRKPDERLPMIVSFYEKTSQYMYRYMRPRYASGAATELMETVSKGTMILLPDVHFNTGATGDDMLECIEAAVDKAVELGYADPDRVGLCGHSFSGYGAAYIATRSKKFAAVCAGAGVMDHVSDFNHLWGYSASRKRGSGSNAHQYDIYGQGRMGTNPHDNFELYRGQSPVTYVKEMTTPLLLMHGEADDTVAWIEPIEMYNAMRFSGKNVILLSYPDEGHGLSKRVNRIDLTRRIMEFFDHHLMGKPAPDWITYGVPFLEKKGE